MKKSLAHRLFLKKRLYTFSMKEGVSIQEHIDVFNKIILDLEGVENIKIGDEDKTFFLMSSLPKSYERFVDTMLYGRTTLTLEDVKASLCSKEIQRHSRDLDQNPDWAEKKRDNKEKLGGAAVASEESSDGGYQSADLLVASNGKIKDKAKLWHLRLGHMSAKGLQELSKKGLLCGDKVEELKLCENCIFGKAHRMKFERRMHKSKAVFDYAHSYLWGLAQVPSLSGGRYISEMKLKALRTDNGLEFCNKEFDEYCQKHGITRHKTIRFTPQQNGLAERMNKTLIDKTRCLLINSKLPRSFWAEAVTIACYLVNRSPSAALKFKTPEEVWTGGVKWYKVWCGATHKCIISRDVTFHEEAMLEDKDRTVFDFSHYTDEPMKEAAVVKDFRIEVESTNSSDKGDQDLARDRARRETKPPSRYAYAGMIAYALNSAENIAIEEPASYREAVKGNRRLVSYKWIFKRKEGIPGAKASRFKARLVARGGAVYLMLYVDDMLLATKDRSEIKKLKDLLNAEFEMKDLGCAKRILGMDIIRDRAAGTLFVSQERYILKAVGCLMYAMVCIRVDIAYAVSLVSRFMSDPGKEHWDIVKWILRYLKGDLDGRKSISGYLFMVNGCLISWKATLQHVVTLSSTEAEFVAATEFPLLSSGFLLKKSAKTNGWSKRWFVLNEKTGKLGYTKKQEERHFLGVIALEFIAILLAGQEIREKEKGCFQPQELGQLLEQTKGSILSIEHTSVSGTIWSGKGRSDFSINILAPSVGSWIKSYHQVSSHQRSSEQSAMDVTRKDALGGDNETGETITLREIANEGRQRMMQDRMEWIEKQMETLTAILHELRDERRNDCETTVVRDEAVAEPSLRRRGIEEISPLVDQPYRVHPHRSAGELRQRLHNAEQERDQIAARDLNCALELEGEVRRLAQVMDEIQGKRKPPSWRIMLDEESPLSAEIMGTVIPRDFRFHDLKYSGRSDPLVHIECFNDMMGVQGLTPAQRCRVFPLTLEGRAREWYHKLPRGSIKGYEHMCQELAEQFRGAVAPEDDMMELMGMKQEEHESLRDFVKRYHRAVLDLGAFNHPQGLMGLKESVRIGRLWYNLKSPIVQNYSAGYEHARRDIEIEEEKTARIKSE
ncbi:Integrase catalytic domain-containing protein [Citrus sinensis]|uniref:Integrase catalytic domain-containing protein n=1 Tax=Citrus sinensis TaxID=2711 RepID=A0ACB8M9I4_CITSI|nr:Integrase catalytic domain-containing protein [Citrus sinensis]